MQGQGRTPDLRWDDDKKATARAKAETCGWLTACIPSFAMRPRRMGHPTHPMISTHRKATARAKAETCGWLTAYIPPFAMRQRRMGHPRIWAGDGTVPKHGGASMISDT